jgi:hypothetical protein
MAGGRGLRTLKILRMAITIEQTWFSRQDTINPDYNRGLTFLKIGLENHFRELTFLKTDLKPTFGPHIFKNQT